MQARLVQLVLVCSLLACATAAAAKELPLADNSTDAAAANLTRMDDDDNSNGTAGVGMLSVWVPDGQEAVVDAPVLRKNTTEYAEPVSASEDYGTVASVAAPPAFYNPNLDLHNSFRARHVSTPPLVWDDAIAANAAAWASRCSWGHDPSNTAQGENLYAYSVDNNKAQFQLDGLNVWYNELRLYDWNRPGFSEAVGHFTQIVWRSTARLGCAVQSCPGGLQNFAAGRVFLVCRYSPPGNFQGQFAANVMPLGGSAPAPSAPQPAATTPAAPAPASPKPVSVSPQQQPASTPPAPAAPPAGTALLATVLRPGSKLSEGTCLPSPNRVFRLCMMTSGQAQLFKQGAAAAIWSSPYTFSSLSRPFSLTLEPSGRLSIMSGGMAGTFLSSISMALWSANTANMGVAPYRLLVQDDGILAVYDSRNAVVWRR